MCWQYRFHSVLLRTQFGKAGSTCWFQAAASLRAAQHATLTVAATATTRAPTPNPSEALPSIRLPHPATPLPISPQKSECPRCRLTAYYAPTSRYPLLLRRLATVLPFQPPVEQPVVRVSSERPVGEGGRTLLVVVPLRCAVLLELLLHVLLL